MTRAEDPELQRIVRQVRSELGFPMALLSLVQQRVQRCHASVGWQRELDGLPVLDRAVSSCCALVVATGRPLEISNVVGDAHLPRDVVRDCGIRSFVGLPLTVCGLVLGSLCAMDTQPRVVTEAQHRRLRQLAVRAASRVAEIAPESLRSEHLIAHALHPAFLEIRNLLNVLLGDISLLGLALGDARILLDLVRNGDQLPSADAREGAFHALRAALLENQDLQVTHERLDTIGTRLARFLLALESSLAPGGESVVLADAVDLADTLARHVTRTVGGVRWRAARASTAAVVGARVATVAGIAAALRLIADGLASGATQGIDGTVNLRRGSAEIALRAPEGTAATYRATAAALAAYAHGGTGFSVETSRAHVAMTWTRAPERPLI